MTIFDSAKAIIRMLDHAEFEYYDHHGKSQCDGILTDSSLLEPGITELLTIAFEELTGTTCSMSFPPSQDNPMSIVSIRGLKEKGFEGFPAQTLLQTIDKMQEQLSKGWERDENGSGDYIRPAQSDDPGYQYPDQQGSPKSHINNLITRYLPEFLQAVEKKPDGAWVPKRDLGAVGIRVKAENISQLEESLAINIQGKSRAAG